MRKADISVVGALPSKPSLKRPEQTHSLSTLILDVHSDDIQATPSPDESYNTLGSKRKRRSTDDGSTTDEEGNTSKKSPYMCRFCNKEFAKSQALGGHMNLHRLERTKEQYSHAQELVTIMTQQNTLWAWNSNNLHPTNLHYDAPQPAPELMSNGCLPMVAVEPTDSTSGGPSTTAHLTTGVPNLSLAHGYP